MVVQYRLYAQDKQLRNAYVQVQKQAEQLRQTLSHAGIPPQQVRLGDYQVTPNFNSKGDKITSFSVSEQLTAELTDFSKSAELVDIASEQNAPSIQSVSFTLKAVEQAKDKAVADGFEKAQRRAEEIARLAGAKIKLSYAAVDVPEPYIPSRAATQELSVAATRVAIPQPPPPTAAFASERITVTAHIHAIFRLEASGT
jgi:uncharacterized protein YggE